MELFWDGSTELGECPTWDVGAQALYWIDIEGKAVHRQDLDGNHSVRVLEGRPGSIALTPLRRCAAGGSRTPATLAALAECFR